MMSYQETQLLPEEAGFDSATVDRLNLAMLSLNSTTTTTGEGPVTSTEEKSTSYGSIKRRSPSSFSFFQEPSSKRATIYPISSTSTSPLPPPPQPPSPTGSNKSTILQHSLSDITALTRRMSAQSPENSSKNNADTSASLSPATAASWALPPLPPTLWRSLSDPISQFQQSTATTTPARPQAGKNIRGSPSSDQESRESKRLKKMKQKLKEMRHRWEKVIREEDKDTFSEDDCSIINSSKDKSDNESESEPEEAVWVEERNGEGLVLHFKCPCARGYEIFLSGSNCYYKL